MGNESKRGSTISLIIIYMLLVILTIVCLFPFLMMIMNATHANNVVTSEVNFLPGNKLLENYENLQSLVNIWRGFLNSIIISVTGTICAAYIGALAAYGFSKYKFKGNTILFWVVMGTMMVPPQLGIIGFFDVVNKLNLFDNIAVLILAMFASAPLLFFVKLYCDSAVPKSVIESARMDGAGEFRTFNSIVLPMITPSLATMGIFTFITSWNNFVIPSIILTSKSSKTLPMLIAESKGSYDSYIASQYVAVAISVVPLIIVFSLLSKYIVSGLTTGAVKG